jgi:hypothetical protein
LQQGRQNERSRIFSFLAAFCSSMLEVGSMASFFKCYDLVTNRSDRSGVEELSVTIHEYPANVPSSFTPPRAVFVIKRTSTGIFGASSGRRRLRFGPSKSVSNFSTSGLAVLSGSPILWFKALHRYLLKISRMTCVGRSNSLLGVSTWTFSASRPCSIKK